MKHELNTRLRDERIRAYSRLLTATASIKMEESERTEGLVEVAEAYSEIQLLTESKKVKDAVYSLCEQHGAAVQSGANSIAKGQDPEKSMYYRLSKKALEGYVKVFLEAAKEELDIAPSTAGLDTATSEESHL